jgi:hypothetical protein
MLAAALTYAAADLPVLPLDGKVPRNKGGLTQASIDPAVVAEWWRRWPDANVGIRTGAASGLLVLDVDTPKGGAGSLAELERRHGALPKTARVLTGGGGQHVYFAHPGQTVRNSAGQLGDGLDVRADGGYVVAPPSVHASGRRYQWMRQLDRGLADPPAWLLEDTERRRNVTAERVADVIPEGRRRDAMLTVAGKLKRAGLTGEEILPTLRELNRRCRPPLDDSELESVALETTLTADPETSISTVIDAAPRPIESVLDVFRAWMHMPDPGLLYAVCAGIAANRVEAFDPTWIIYVGPAGSGKTETLAATSRLPGVHVVGTLTEAALLSGTPRKDAATDASGGLLREIGESGTLILKDFGSILSMHRDARAAVLAALRELFDGSWTRLVGVDGGRRLHWEGRLGLLAGATSALDQHHGVMAQLGERFLLHRVDVADADAQARSSLAHHGRERVMRQELTEAVAGLFAGLDLTEPPPPLTAADTDRLIALATLVARARSPVVRDAYRRELELVLDSEAPGRIVGALGRILTGLRLIGVPDGEAWRVTVKTGLDSMPAIRLRTLKLLLDRDVATTTDVATAFGLPNPTTHRTLEELAAHGVIRRESQGQGKADHWHMEPWARDRYRDATSSEMSEGISFPLPKPKTIYDDKTEEVAP